LKVSLKNLSLSLALCHPDLLLCAGSTKSLPNALHYARRKSSTSMGRSPPKEHAFISVLAVLIFWIFKLKAEVSGNRPL
jgi:hypothetical protein